MSADALRAVRGERLLCAFERSSFGERLFCFFRNLSGVNLNRSHSVISGPTRFSALSTGRLKLSGRHVAGLDNLTSVGVQDLKQAVIQLYAQRN
jgi:hypothetical protein